MFALEKNKKFVKPEPPVPVDDMDFDMDSVVSATECTGMGRVMPIYSMDEDISDICNAAKKDKDKQK